MKLWTVQVPEVWRLLREHGRVHVSWEYADPDLEPAYRWLAKRMGLPATDAPVWAWYWWPASRTGRPDLRSSQAWTGSRQVLIELEVPAYLATLTDYTGWHSVLNNQPLPPREAEDWTEAEYDAWYDAQDRRDIEASWAGIFTNEYLDPDEGIQATLPYLDVSWVQSVREFVSR